MLPPLPTALDLGHLYAALFGPLLPLPAWAGETLEDHVARCDEFQSVTKRIDQLATRIRREKQFDRKVALNEELNPSSTNLKARPDPNLVTHLKPAVFPASFVRNNR